MRLRSWGWIPLLLLLPLRVQSGDLYHIRQLPEPELTARYTAMLADACRYADRVWQESTNDPAAGHWGSGRSDNMNEGVRAIAGMVLACGALAKYDRELGEADRQVDGRLVRDWFAGANLQSDFTLSNQPNRR
jgi:hypothetical protein